MKIYKICRLFVLLVCACGIQGITMGQVDSKKMNVLFILVDDLRPNLGCYGDPIAVTPQIDALARRGVLFNHAYCQQAVCNPSRASMLTGLRPDETGVVNLQSHFRTKNPDVVTLPQWFKQNGYYTVGIGKTTHGTKATEDEISWTKEISASSDMYALPENRVKKGKGVSIEMADVSDDMYSDGKIARNTITVIREAQKGEAPFFVAVGFRKPHAPFNAPKKYWDMYDRNIFKVKNRNRPEGSPDLAFHQWQELRGYKDIPKSEALSVEKEQELQHGYYACISYVDEQVGKIVRELERQKLLDHTIIVLWGDHGYHLGEQDLWCKSTNFELDVRVPLLIVDPRRHGNGRQSNAVVETVDLYPTLNQLCGIEPTYSLSGISLKPLLDNPAEKWEYPAFSQFVRPYDVILGKGAETHMGYSVRIDGFRATYWYSALTKSWDHKELYVLEGDNLEEKNVSGQKKYRDIERRLADLLKSYQQGNYRKIDSRQGGVLDYR